MNREPLLFVQSPMVLPVDIIQKLDYASEQSGYATVKLQRIEKALGIKNKQS